MFTIPLSHLLFEFATYILLVMCFWHAVSQKDRYRELLAILISGTLYGLILEAMTIYQLHSYKYGAFLVMFHNEIPLTIGIGWGIILYSAIITADSLKLSFPAWVATVGLFGLGIDATMDVMAVRTGMWRWYLLNSYDGRFLAPDQDWFGVTFGNYYAWFIVLTSAAAFIRLLKMNSSPNLFTLVLKCSAAIVSSIVVLGVLDQLYVAYANHTWWPVLLEIILAISVISLSLLKKNGVSRDAFGFMGAPALIVPLFFHLYFTGLIICAIFQPSIICDSDMKNQFRSQVPVLLTISSTLLVIAVVFHMITKKRVVRTQNRTDVDPVLKMVKISGDVTASTESEWEN